MNKTVKIIMGLIVVLALSAGNLWAEIIEIDFTAEITWVGDAGGLLDGQINAGDIITGSYTYNSSTLDINPSDTVADYLYSSSPYGISISAGGFVFQTDPNIVSFFVEIINNHYSGGLYEYEDAYVMGSDYNLLLSNGVPVDTIYFHLRDTSADALSSTALPTSAPVLEDWDEHYLLIGGGVHGEIHNFVFQAEITEIVPEPTTLLLFGLGGLALRRKCKTHR